ncbi:MAG: hypothetical protein RIS35_389, partial [Pseudomonadota bacterium]
TAISAPAFAGGFETPSTLAFRMNAVGQGLYIEQLRQSLNASAGGVGAVNAQTQSNMSNVVQITENYDIVLNGSGNTVNSGGGYSGQQASTDSAQTTDNQINVNSNVASARGSSTLSGSAVSAGGSNLLNP